MAQPLIVLIASSSAQSVAVSRGFKSLSHVLYPFTSHETTVRDPVSNRSIVHKIRADIRDISNDGHLLSLSVLPYVLVQALKSAKDIRDATDSFKQVLTRWAEPSEHESFGAYLACLFVISSNDENAMGELSKMIQTQQTLYNSSSTLLIPPYCCSPKWATEHSRTLKHYILLHDTSINDSSTKRDELYNQMCSIYGTDNCQVLQFDSTTECPNDLIKLWNEIDELNDILNRGLEEAMKHASNPSSIPGSANSPPPSSVSTISVPLSVSSVTKSSPTNVFWKNSHKNFSKQDADNCTSVVQKFITNCLSPFVEKEIRSLLEQIGNRRGILAKGISIGMKKWFGNGSSPNISSTAAASYSWDSPEMLTRRVADLAFAFGNYHFAYGQYRTLKRDFEADQSMIAHALAAEMCAVAMHISDPHSNPKQFPVRYLDDSLGHLLHNSARYSLIMRCAINSELILSDLAFFKEAATSLSRLSSLEGDHLVGVAQSLAANMFEKAGMCRKASFYRVLAANRFANAGIHNIAFDCYRLAMPNFNEQHWGVLDEHLSMKLLIEGEKAGVMTSKMAMDCVRRLITVCPKLNEAQQIDRLKKIIHVLDAYGNPNESIRIDLPKVDLNGIKVIYGERPMWNEIDDDENKNITSDEWISIERSAHHTLFSSSTPFRGMQLVSDCYSDNQKVRETPTGERYRVMIDLTNPLNIPVNLKNVKLSVSNSDVDVGELEELQIQGNETKTIELYVFPRIGGTSTSFKVDALLFKLIESGKVVDCQIPLECKGKRLNKTSKQQKSKVYAVDERLSAIVSSKPWPLLEFKVLKSPSVLAYCDQAMRYVIEVENIGKEDVVSMCLTTTGHDRVSCGIVEANGSRVDAPLKMAVNNKQLANFTLGENSLKIGEKRTLFIDVRASESESKNVLALLLAYRGVNGIMREWRKVLNVEQIPLLCVEANMLDEQTGTFSLKMTNCLSSSQAALSRVELQRIRCAKNGNDNNGLLEIVSHRKIEIESEQNDTIVVKMSRTSGRNEVWLGEKLAEVPNWPPPVVDNDVYSTDNDSKKIERKIGLLWKANIVNNDGQVSSIIGETFVDDPFDREGAIHPNSDALEHPSKLRISCDAIRQVSHNFNDSRIAELPIKIQIQNIDSKHRAAAVSIRYVSKVRDPVEGVHLIPPENRQQLWVDRPVRRINLEGNEKKEVVIRVRMSKASVYDVVGANNLVVDAVFDGSDEKFTYTVSSILSVVKAI